MEILVRITLLYSTWYANSETANDDKKKNKQETFPSSAIALMSLQVSQIVFRVSHLHRSYQPVPCFKNILHSHHTILFWIFPPPFTRSLAWRTAQLRLFIFSSLGRRWKFLALLTRSFLKSVRSVINKFRLMRLREKGKGKKGKMLSTFCSAHNVSNRVWFH